MRAFLPALAPTGQWHQGSVGTRRNFLLLTDGPPPGGEKGGGWGIRHSFAWRAVYLNQNHDLLPKEVVRVHEDGLIPSWNGGVRLRWAKMSDHVPTGGDEAARLCRRWIFWDPCWRLGSRAHGGQVRRVPAASRHGGAVRSDDKQLGISARHGSNFSSIVSPSRWDETFSIRGTHSTEKMQRSPPQAQQQRMPSSSSARLDVHERALPRSFGDPLPTVSAARLCPSARSGMALVGQRGKDQGRLI